MDKEGNPEYIKDHEKSDGISIIIEKEPYSLVDILDDVNITYEDSIQIIHGLLLAVDYLHMNNIIHLDINPSNILITSDLKTKLCDFGLSYIKSDRCNLPSWLVTEGYRAPEIKEMENYDEKIDIYSVGRVIEDIVEYCGDGYLKYSKLRDLATLCKSENPKVRPSSKDLLNMEIFKGCKKLNHKKKTFRNRVDTPIDSQDVLNFIKSSYSLLGEVFNERALFHAADLYKSYRSKIKNLSDIQTYVVMWYMFYKFFSHEPVDNLQDIVNQIVEHDEILEDKEKNIFKGLNLENDLIHEVECYILNDLVDWNLYIETPYENSKMRASDIS
jgi:serine/threonine protein kinase